MLESSLKAQIFMDHTEMFSLAGKVAAVVGGGGVLAGEMAMGLAGAGADVAILDFNPAGAEARAEAVRALGRRAIGIPATRRRSRTWKPRWPGFWPSSDASTS